MCRFCKSAPLPHPKSNSHYANVYSIQYIALQILARRSEYTLRKFQCLCIGDHYSGMNIFRCNSF